MDVAPVWATLVDTKGPEICTAMLLDGKSIMLEKDQKIVIEAVGDKYTSYQGYKKSNGDTRIGLSYTGLCSSVGVGDQILLAGGSISIIVDDILSGSELCGTVQNGNELGELQSCNLPGSQIKVPVLTDKDIYDLKEFACKHKVDFVAAFVQNAEDVRAIRAVLDSAGGFDMKVIAKIENLEGLKQFDEILCEADGVMVARGSLGALLL
jgi:pyruvate kinase